MTNHSCVFPDENLGVTTTTSKKSTHVLLSPFFPFLSIFCCNKKWRKKIEWKYAELKWHHHHHHHIIITKRGSEIKSTIPMQECNMYVCKYVSKHKWQSCTQTRPHIKTKKKKRNAAAQDELAHVLHICLHSFLLVLLQMKKGTFCNPREPLALSSSYPITFISYV